MAVWEGVSEFVAVVEAQSFTAAAKRLDSSVANVSRRVTTLENRLGAKLFQRTTRKVSVTEEGRLYYRHCRQVLDSLEEADRAITNLQSKPIGKLRMTAPVAYGEQYIAPLVNEFLISHKALEIELRLTNQQVDLIEEGFDLAIRLGDLKQSRLVAKRLASRVHYVCASPTYSARCGEPHTLPELEEHNCLLGTLDYWRFSEAGTVRSIRVKGSLRCNSGPALVDAALKGLGLVQLPDYYVADYVASGELVTVLDPFQRQPEGIWALYPQNRHLSPRVRQLVDFLAERLPAV
ncbi:MAG: LysR substrate-binding domain-containing protein [Halopseudomonas sp.]